MSLDQIIQDIEASGYDKLMAALPELPERFEAHLHVFHSESKDYMRQAIRDYAIAAMQAYNKILMQAITDPENQPSQFGTVTLSSLEAMTESREFYELCQTYRHSVIGAEEFEALKTAIRNPDTRTTP